MQKVELVAKKIFILCKPKMYCPHRNYKSHFRIKLSVWDPSCHDRITLLYAMEAEQRIRAVRIRVWSGCCGEVLLDRKGALGIICGYLGFFCPYFLRTEKLWHYK